MTLFISFEGGDGSGKSTQADALHKRLEDSGVDCLFVREPGSTPLGEVLRAWLKREHADENEMSPVAELFLFEAARAELVEKSIRPALDDGKVVVADRYADSTVAYQGYGRGIPVDVIEQMNKTATSALTPDLTFLLDCPAGEGLARVGAMKSTADASRNDAPGTRRFEQESLEFHTRVRDGYREIARREPARWHVIDGTQTPEQIASEIWAIAQRRLAQGSPSDS
jgi:dTMP kinase